MPNSVISSPIHIKRSEPAETRKTLIAKPNGVSAVTMPWLSSRERNATDCKIANGMVSMRLQATNLVRPASPSSVYIFLTCGEITVASCITIEAVMYGPTPSITSESVENPPPEKTDRRPKNWLLLKNCSSATRSTPGIGIAARMRNTVNAARINPMRHISTLSESMSLVLCAMAFAIEV